MGIAPVPTSRRMRRLLMQLSVTDAGAPRTLPGNRRIMGNDDDGYLFFRIQADKKLHDLRADLRVQGASRLIGQDDARFSDQGPGDGYSLLLSAGELIRLVTAPVPQADLVQDSLHASLDLLVCQTSIYQRNTDVFLGSQARQQIEGLKHEADAGVPNDGQLVVASARDFSSSQEIGAVRGLVQQADDIHQGRFTTPRWPHDRQQVASVHLEVNPPQDLHGNGADMIRLADIYQSAA